MNRAMAVGGALGLVACGVCLGQEGGRFAGNCSDAACHGSLTKGPVVHNPVGQGACDTCHQLQPGTEHKFRLVQSEGALCAECHENVTKDLTFVHGPVAAGACTSCHDAHRSDHPKLLLRPEKEMCLDCHESIAERFDGAKGIHRPAADGCLSCHAPHGAKNKMMLTSETPGLCLDCHDAIGEKISAGTVKHSPVSTGRNCLQCHEAHATPAKGLLLKPGLDLCMSCHNQELESSGGKIANLAALMAANPHKHGPVADGECAACHDPHGGNRDQLLTRDYPSKFYVAFEEKKYALCLDCHDAEAFTEKETEDATKFRDGTRNLHYVHVNQIKGRSCRVCHDPHSSKNAKHLVESAPFGNWRIPLNFKETATGGSCQSGCHKAATYDRETLAKSDSEKKKED